MIWGLDEVLNPDDISLPIGTEVGVDFQSLGMLSPNAAHHLPALPAFP